MKTTRFTIVLSAAALLLARSAFGQTIEVKTTYGRGADSYVDEVANTGFGSNERLLGRRNSPSQNYAALLRFDLRQIVPGSITAATLKGYSFHTDAGSCTAVVFGLRDNAANQLWDESTTTASTTTVGGWTTVSAPPVSANGQLTVTVPTTEAAQFYRLHGPAARSATVGDDGAGVRAAILASPSSNPQSLKRNYEGILW